MKPSIGRIVHYVSYGTPNGEYKSECRAAIITSIQNITNPHMDDEVRAELNNMVSLTVFNPEGMFFPAHVRYFERGTAIGMDLDEVKQGGTWHWPEQVE